MEALNPSAIHTIISCDGDFYDCKNIDSLVFTVPFALIRTNVVYFMGKVFYGL